eukprot:jgi/Mesvir1/4698/Mv21593-RA.1
MNLFTARISRQGDLKPPITGDVPISFTPLPASDAPSVPVWTGPATGWSWSTAPNLAFETTKLPEKRQQVDHPITERQPSERETPRPKESRPVACTRRGTLFACLLFGALIACGLPFMMNFESPSSSDGPADVVLQGDAAALQGLQSLALASPVDAGSATDEETRDGASDDEEDDLNILIPDSTPEQRDDDEQQEWVQELDGSRSRNRGKTKEGQDALDTTKGVAGQEGASAQASKGGDKATRRGRGREEAGKEGAGRRKRLTGKDTEEQDTFGGNDDDNEEEVDDSDADGGDGGGGDDGRQRSRRRERAPQVDVRFGDKEAMRDLFSPPAPEGSQAEDEGSSAMFRIPEDGLPRWDAAAAKKRPPECQNNDDCNRSGRREGGDRRRPWCVDGVCKCPVLWAGSSSCSKRTPLDDWCLQPMDSLPPSQIFFDNLGARTNRTIFSRILNRAAGPALNRSRMDQFTLNLEDEAALKLTRGSTRYMIGRKFGAFQLPQKDMVKGLDLSSCAVVGNSDSVLQHKDGPIIDAHAMVIRFNEAPTVGYEQHVGSKTTIRIQNKEYSGFAEDPHEICLVKLYQYFYRSKSLCRVVQFSPQFQLYALRYWSVFPPTHWPGGLAMHTGKMSSGFMGLAFALHLCGHVSVFGMSQGEEHYFLKFSDKIPVAKLAELESKLNATTTREEARVLRTKITEQRALIRELKAKQRAVKEAYDRDIYRWGHPRRGPHPSSHAHEKRHPWEVERGCMRTLSMLPSVTHYS